MQSTSKAHFLTIGTRGSPLALAQAEEVKRQLVHAHNIPASEIAITVIKTDGDRSQASNRPLSEIGGKGLFSKEIEQSLLSGTIDIGVHSSKDMATTLPDGLVMPVFLPREDVRDVFISAKATSLDDLAKGAIIGTSSIRRRAQMLRFRPDLEIVEFRGNVGTRLQKLADGLADATLLAAAGLLRTGQAHAITAYLDPNDFPPAPAQGAIGIELREDDARTRALIQPLNDPDTNAAISAERAFLRVLDGSCRTPIAALSTLTGTTLSLRGQILSLDGREMFEAVVTGSVADPVAIGEGLGHQLLERAGADFFTRLRATL